MVAVDKCFWCKSEKLKKVAERKDGVAVNECGDCSLLLVAEIPENLADYYDEEAYFNPEGETETGYHENYDLISPFYLYWQGALIEEIARKANKNNLLEVGCATGNALEMINLFNNKIEVQGIDLSSYAIKTCKEKGLTASVSKIEDFNSNEKFGMIFSSETMEHVDSLNSFIEGIKNNLEDNGVYIFYVPAVDRELLIKESKTYPSLTTSLEHVSYFTKSFLEKAFNSGFDASVYVHRFSTEGEAEGDDYALGVVSANKELVSYTKKFIEAFENYKKGFSKSPQTLYNLAVIAAKFGNSELAAKYLSDLENLKQDESKIYFLKGLLSYNKGELIKSRKFFNKYLGGKPANNFQLKVLLAVESGFSSIYAAELNDYRSKAQDLEVRVSVAETDLADFRQSKIVGSAIKARYVLGKTLDPIRNKKKIISETSGGLIKLIPHRLRPKLRYIFKQQWRVKYETYDNLKIPINSPVISVIIPYFNRASTIDETIISLQSQTINSFEVIIVDDGSTDASSVKKLSNLKLDGLNAKIIKQANGGVAAARNKGIEASRGKYIVCLDSDDVLDPTYLEKCLVVLETNPEAKIATTDMRIFGVNSSVYIQGDYNPEKLISNNMVITAAMFTREAWEQAGGYKPSIGYEDWEFWINLAENGFWGVNIPELLFNYRTAASSRYIEDKASHSKNVDVIKELHPGFQNKVHKIRRYNKFHKRIISPESLFINLGTPAHYKYNDQNLNENILIAIPWMTFGGAETLIYNFCNELKEAFNLSFITGLDSKNEWEYKFREITPNIYHLANLFDDKKLYVEFISNYVSTRKIKVLHIIHNGFMFGMLPELKKRHPQLKVIVTMFNDRVEYFEESTKYQNYIDAYSTDNKKVENHYKKLTAESKKIYQIPNGIDVDNTYNPTHFNADAVREALSIPKGCISCFFIGRLSSEKNPDVFVEVASRILKQNSNIAFFVIGDGPMGKDVQKSIKHIGSGRITYLGYKSEVAEYLAAADVFILPSSIEGFPLSLLEAMSMGVVPIASKVGAVDEIIEDGITGFVINPPGSTAEITKIIGKIAKNPELIDSIGISAREAAVKKFSSKTLGKKYDSMYKEVVR